MNITVNSIDSFKNSLLDSAFPTLEELATELMILEKLYVTLKQLLHRMEK